MLEKKAMPEPQLTILHVDDNEANHYVVTRILQNAGFTVVEAVTGTAGLAAIAEYQPALVILDVQLPDMNGFEVCRQIKANPETASIPVLHLSASYVQSQDKAEGLDSGADAYLVQPVEPIELLATVRALLRIRRAEEAALASAREWRTTFEAINDGVGLVDRDGRFLRCNDALSRLFCQPVSEILGCVHDGVLQAALGVGDGTCFRLAKATHQRQVTELHAKGRWYAKTVDPVLDDQGTFAGAVLILADITDRKQAEARLQEQNYHLSRLTLSLQEQTEQAQQANRIKDEFLAVLSHELRSPLNPILGWTRLLQNGKLDEVRRAEALRTVERNAKLQSQLIEDLLDISRIMQGKLSLTVVPVDLAYVIAAAVETVRLAAEAKQIQVTLDLDAAVSSISGDAARLQQVVWNLLANAVKFTPNGGQVMIKLGQIGSLAHIRVIDTGKGINPQFLPHVFEYFRQEDGSTTRRFGGLGLGLAIVRQIVEMHGGTVRAESQGEGQGATFIVELPTLRQKAAIASEPTPTQIDGEVPLFGIQILLVDDDPDTREFQAFLLEQNGATVTAVASGLEALQVLEQFVPDLLVSDIGMAEMDGYMLLQQIRLKSPDQGGTIPAIALTAYAAEIDQQRALQVGFQNHITKPVAPEVLMKAIASLGVCVT